MTESASRIDRKGAEQLAQLVFNPRHTSLEEALRQAVFYIDCTFSNPDSCHPGYDIQIRKFGEIYQITISTLNRKRI
jgi:hypothetical protein